MIDQELMNTLSSHARTVAITRFMWGGFLCSVGGGLWKVMFKASKGVEIGEFTSEKNMDKAMVVGFCGVVGLIALLLGINCLCDGVIALWSPGYWAMKEAMKVGG